MTDSEYTIKSDKGKEVARSVANDTFVGIREGFFANSTSEFASLFAKESGSHVGSPEFATTELKKQVASYYGQ